MKPRILRIETSDRTLRSDLEEAHIGGLTVSIRLEASAATHDLALLAIEITRDVAIPLFVNWLYDRIIKSKSDDTTIDGVQVPKDVKQLTDIVSGKGEIVQKPQRRPTKKKK